MEVDGDDPPQANPNTAQQAAIKLRDACQPSKQIILGAFTRPYKAYFDRAEDIIIDASLKKLATTNTLEESTAATKERLDMEESVDIELLDTIIRKKVTAQTNKLNTELGQLKRQMSIMTKKQPAKNAPENRKNTRRGQTTTTGASTRKKKSSTNRSSPSSIVPLPRPTPDKPPLPPTVLQEKTLERARRKDQRRSPRAGRNSQPHHQHHDPHPRCHQAVLRIRSKPKLFRHQKRNNPSPTPAIMTLLLPSNQCGLAQPHQANHRYPEVPHHNHRSGT